MDQLFIKKTASTPQIDFRNTGQMSIKGSLLPEDPKVFFTPIFNWVDTTEAKEIDIEVKLEYINTSSSKRIIELLKAIDKRLYFKSILLKWYYEADDSDMLEFGELIQRNNKRTNIQFIECEDLGV